MSVDLHLHTYYSDGSWSPSQLVQAARALKLKHIAVTDHDTLAGIDEARQEAAGDLEVITGIEINTVYRSAEGADVDVHILGYFLDPSCRALKDIIERQQAAREKLVDDTIEKLAGKGIKLTRDSIAEFAGRGSIGRPHITRAIVAAGGAASIGEAFELYMTRGSEYYVSRASVAPQDAIAAINASGGVASVAHPGNNKEMEAIIVELKACGLKAVEAFHRAHTLTLVKHYMKFARQNGLGITGGSDCHGPYRNDPPSIGSVRVPLHVVHDLKALQINGMEVSRS
jgi:predicted metal-dependent phosphoesterase TrpH